MQRYSLRRITSHLERGTHVVEALELQWNLLFRARPQLDQPRGTQSTRKPEAPQYSIH